MEANVVANVPGKAIVFCRREDLNSGWLANTAAEQNNYDYFRHHYRLGRRQRLRYSLASWLRVAVAALASRRL
jgi:hypothetical protein